MAEAEGRGGSVTPRRAAGPGAHAPRPRARGRRRLLARPHGEPEPGPDQTDALWFRSGSESEGEEDEEGPHWVRLIYGLSIQSRLRTVVRPRPPRGRTTVPP